MRQGLYRVSIRLGLHSLGLDPKISASTLSDEVVQDEEAEASTQPIRIEDNLHAVTPSPDAPEVYDISDISSPHMAEIEEDIQISDIE